MSDGDVEGAELSMRPPALETFISHLAEIAPDADQPITAQSHLIEDLKFEGLAFSRLGLLMYTHYGIGGLSTASLSENLTVESFFERCILNVLGVGDAN
jgi:hypothetical protein